MPSPTVSSRCSACGSEASGKFCAECGAQRLRNCATCGTQLQSDARFCKECGAGAEQRGGSRRLLPGRRRTRIAAASFAIGITCVVVIIAIHIGQRPAPVPELPDAPVAIQQGIVNAPDISALSPRERATRLYKRVLRLHDERKTDSVAFFAPMALAAYAEVQDINGTDKSAMARIASIARRDAAATR